MPNNKFNIKISGVDIIKEHLKKLQRYQEPTYIHEVLSQLADIGVRNATLHFTIFQNYERITDKPNVNVSWENDNTISVVAQGERVTFIEFGTGVTYNSNRDYPQAEALGMTIGGYGKGKGNNKYWWFSDPDPNLNATHREYTRKDGTKVVMPHSYISYGNKPAYAMYNATKEMRDKIIDVIRGVFQ